MQKLGGQGGVGEAGPIVKLVFAPPALGAKSLAFKATQKLLMSAKPARSVSGLVTGGFTAVVLFT